MTQDEIIQKLSDEADVATAHVHWSHNATDSERRKFWRNTFAALVAAHEREKRTQELMQLFLDPENQPTQFGTATLEYREQEVLAEREACAKLCYGCNKDLEEANAKYGEQAEQDQVHIENIYKRGNNYFAWICDDYVQIYTAPVRTKDLTDDEIHKAFYSKNTGLINGIRAVIAADREKNRVKNDCGGAHHHRYAGSFGD